MEEKTIYFAKKDIYSKIKQVGGTWNDSKDRPIVCLIESKEHEGLYWAIPMGNWNHRNEEAKKRIETYLNYPDDDIRSCYYHLGRTTIKSIFFISDAIPITDYYIDKPYMGFDNKAYVIKNKTLLDDLEYKLTRILTVEKGKNNYFRQHITDIKYELIAEIEQQVALAEVAVGKVED